MKIAFFPYFCQANKYIEIMQFCMKDKNRNEIVDFTDVESGVECADIVVLNWYENLRTRRVLYGIYETIRRMKLIHQIKKSGTKIIYVFHNKKVHGDIFSSWSNIMARYFFNIANGIIVLTQSSTEFYPLFTKNVQKAMDKTYFIPHPNYIGLYGGNQGMYTRKSLNISSLDIVYLFIGMVKPYKNIELILNSANEMEKSNVHFVIAGKPESENYAKKLTNLIKNHEKVTTIFKFIPDTDIPTLMEMADVVLLPYDISSSLNSGTVYLSFSCKRTVICPEIATIKDCPKGLVFSYNYLTQKEHLKNLKRSINEFYNQYYNNRKELEKLNNRVYQYVKEFHSVEIVKKECENMLVQLH